MSIVGVYALNEDATEVTTDAFYEEFQDTLNKINRGTETILLAISISEQGQKRMIRQLANLERK